MKMVKTLFCTIFCMIDRYYLRTRKLLLLQWT